MTAIDPSTDIGRLRLRVADVSDLPFFTDAVYESVLADNSGNVPRTARTIAMYILGILSQRTHRKMGLLEVWGDEAAKAYKDFLMLTVTNPHFMDFSPIPYSSESEYSPIMDFQDNWNKNYANGTESQQLAINADMSPNDNSRTGGFIYG